MTTTYAILIFIGFVCFVGIMCLLVLALQAGKRAVESTQEERQDTFQHEIRLQCMDHVRCMEQAAAKARQGKQILAEGEILAKIASRVTGTMEGFTNASNGRLNLKLDNRKTYAPKQDVTYIHPTIIPPVVSVTPIQPVFAPLLYGEKQPVGYYPPR